MRCALLLLEMFFVFSCFASSTQCPADLEQPSAKLSSISFATIKDSNTLFLVTKQGQFVDYDHTKNEILVTQQGERGEIEQAAFAHDGRWVALLVVRNNKRYVRIFDGNEDHLIQCNDCREIAWNRSQSSLALRRDHVVSFVSMKNPSKFKSPFHFVGWTKPSFHWSPQGDYCLVQDRNRDFYVWSATTHKRIDVWATVLTPSGGARKKIRSGWARVDSEQSEPTLFLSPSAGSIIAIDPIRGGQLTISTVGDGWTAFAAGEKTYFGFPDGRVVSSDPKTKSFDVHEEDTAELDTIRFVGSEQYIIALIQRFNYKTDEIRVFNHQGELLNKMLITHLFSQRPLSISPRGRFISAHSGVFSTEQIVAEGGGTHPITTFKFGWDVPTRFEQLEWAPDDSGALSEWGGSVTYHRYSADHGFEDFEFKGEGDHFFALDGGRLARLRADGRIYVYNNVQRERTLTITRP